MSADLKALRWQGDLDCVGDAERAGPGGDRRRSRAAISDARLRV